MRTRKFSLSISGNISRDEIKELAKELDPLGVYPNKLETFSAEIPEYINLAFRNFDTITFLRDFVLSSILTATVSKVHDWSKSKHNKKIKGIWVVYLFNMNGKNFSLNIMSNMNNLEKIFNEAKNILTKEYIQENTKEGSTVSFGWNEKENKIDSFIQ